MNAMNQTDRLQDRTHWIGLAVSIGICLGAGGLGAIATTPEIEGWYRTVTKPAWNPPDYVFGPVWSTLYLMMGISGWAVWKQSELKTASKPLSLFAVQLGLNVAWSWIFFGMHQPGWALLEIAVLWVAIVATIAVFFRRSKLAGWLLVPYLCWVSFASVLNFAIWRLNGP
jgi:translocator protein